MNAASIFEIEYAGATVILIPQRDPDELDFYPVTADFGTATQELHIGGGAIATPRMAPRKLPEYGDPEHSKTRPSMASGVLAANRVATCPPRLWPINTRGIFG